MFKKSLNLLNLKPIFERKMSSVDSQTIQVLSDIAHRLRIHSIEATSASNSGYNFTKKKILNKSK